ncbi:MAG: prepilin-type N-terminal cleavage/methylation domain-containing protein [Actinomycetota bacterium]
MSPLPEADTTNMERTDRGFTLVELLIVIVVLGVLSSISVFAVRGITDRSEDASCSADLEVLVKAQESHAVLFGTYADTPTLVAAGLLGSESQRYDVAGDADGYTLTPAVDSPCTDTAGTSTAAPPPPPVVTADGPLAAAGPPSPAEDETYAGIEGWEWYSGINVSGTTRPNDEVVVFGRGEAAGQYIAMVAADPAISRRVTLLDLDDVSTSDDIDDAIDRARSTGVTTWVLYTADDSGLLTDTGQSVAAYMSAAASPDDYRQLGPGGDLLALVTSIG